VYVKASLTRDEPADALTYKAAHKDSPHETTVDQWFTESQFESYRRLGQHIIEKMFKEDHQTVSHWAHNVPPNTVFNYLENHWGEHKTTNILKSKPSVMQTRNPEGPKTIFSHASNRAQGLLYSNGGPQKSARAQGSEWF
jgi:hypothetical protein